MGLTVTFKVLDRDRLDLANVSLRRVKKTLIFDGGFRIDECACLHCNRKYVSFLSFFMQNCSVFVFCLFVFKFQPKCQSAEIV